jgi:hypothetical protein
VSTENSKATEPLWLPSNEMAKRLHIGRSKLRDLCASGVLRPGDHFFAISSNHYRFDPVATEAALLEHSRRTIVPGETYALSAGEVG